MTSNAAATEHHHPHHTMHPCEHNRILNNVLDHIGGTPMIRINKITKTEGLECELVAKCEFFNAGGSVKDRIGKRMVEAAEKEGKITPGKSVLIEPTSGNTGIGLALAAAVKGYRAIITMPEKMSQEKVDILKGLGAEIIRTPTEAAWDSPDSHIGVAKRLNAEIPHSIIPDQYANINNPLAHYEGTAEEIIEQCGGKIDMFVATAGTGGTISGVAKRLKEKFPNVIIVGVDPNGSILAQPEALNKEGIHSYQVEGIGYDFIPKVLERSSIDEWIKTDDKESFLMARRLLREEGFLCGGSSGSAVVGAIKAAKRLKPGQRCVVLLADSIRNYMSKHLNDDWMKAHNFADLATKQAQETSRLQWGGATIADLHLPIAVTVPDTTTCEAAIAIMQSKGFDQLPVTRSGTSDPASPRLVGLVTLGNLLARISSQRTTLAQPVSTAMFTFPAPQPGSAAPLVAKPAATPAKKKPVFLEITVDTPLENLDRFFDHHPSAVVTQRGKDGELKVLHVVTKIDLLGFLVKRNASVGK